VPAEDTVQYLGEIAEDTEDIVQKEFGILATCLVEY
jgi:hypothetical protein